MRSLYTDKSDQFNYWLVRFCSFISVHLCILSLWDQCLCHAYLILSAGTCYATTIEDQNARRRQSTTLIVSY